jgi:pectinesterase
MFTVTDSPSLMTAINNANNLGVCGRVYIRLMPGEYSGQVLQVPSKTSAPGDHHLQHGIGRTKTVISHNLAAATAGSMTNSATLTVKALRGFQMKNLTVANTYVEGSATGNQSAVAILLQSDRSQFENVRFIGNIGTLYIKSSSELIKARSYFRDCYIEGDQDFIVGRGTAVLRSLRDQIRGQPDADRRQHRLPEHAGLQRLRLPVSTAATSRGDRRQRRDPGAAMAGRERHGEGCRSGR